MLLKQILNNCKPIESIEVRTNSPLDTELDMLFGFCSWDGNTLSSLDGDYYTVNEEITKYHAWLDENGKQHLIIWIETKWEDLAPVGEYE